MYWASPEVRDLHPLIMWYVMHLIILLKNMMQTLNISLCTIRRSAFANTAISALKKKEGCIQKDDMEQIYEKLQWADCVLIGTPVYQGTLSGQTKTMLDRCRALVASDPAALQNKVGAAAAVGGDRVGGQELAIRSILDFYVISEMIPVGGGSFGANLGGTFWSKDKGAKGVSEDTDGIRSMHRTIKRLIAVAEMVKG